MSLNIIFVGQPHVPWWICRFCIKCCEMFENPRQQMVDHELRQHCSTSGWSFLDISWIFTLLFVCLVKGTTMDHTNYIKLLFQLTIKGNYTTLRLVSPKKWRSEIGFTNLARSHHFWVWTNSFLTTLYSTSIGIYRLFFENPLYQGAGYCYSWQCLWQSNPFKTRGVTIHQSLFKVVVKILSWGKLYCSIFKQPWKWFISSMWSLKQLTFLGPDGPIARKTYAECWGLRAPQRLSFHPGTLLSWELDGHFHGFGTFWEKKWPISVFFKVYMGNSNSRWFWLVDT